MSNIRYECAREDFAEMGIDAEAAMDILASVPISVHCWQGDDIHGFEGSDGPTGGIQATGNYPGRARNAEELMCDFDMAMSHIPGKKRLNLHAIYAITDEKVGRDKLLPKHFSPWVDYAKARGIGLDFNSTFFSHKMAEDDMTLSHPDPSVRDYWVEHAIRCREIAKYFADETGGESLHDLWIQDGLKAIPADRLTPRLRLKESLDRVFEKKLDGVVDAVESKLFGIGLENYTVGSSEFYIAYASRRNDVCVLLDNGHYHPTEVVSDKIPSLLAFFDRLPLHVTRGVRWDSDHVVLLEDELVEIAKEIVREDALSRVMIGLDYFDASINRVAAWIIGARNMQKALLIALLTPHKMLAELQDTRDFTKLMALSESIKLVPYEAVWNEYVARQGVGNTRDWLADLDAYERDVQFKRV